MRCCSAIQLKKSPFSCRNSYFWSKTHNISSMWQHSICQERSLDIPWNSIQTSVVTQNDKSNLVQQYFMPYYICHLFTAYWTVCLKCVAVSNSSSEEPQWLSLDAETLVWITSSGEGLPRCAMQFLWEVICFKHHKVSLWKVFLKCPSDTM